MWLATSPALKVCEEMYFGLKIHNQLHCSVASLVYMLSL